MTSPDLTLLLKASVEAVEADPTEARERFHAVAEAAAPHPAACPNCGKRHRSITSDQCKDRSMSERTLQDRVMYRARKRGWKIAHAGRGEVAGRWVTPMAPGWPDLFLVRGSRALAIELKKEQGVLEPEQLEWLQALNEAGIPAILVRPSDLREKRVDAVLA